MSGLKQKRQKLVKQLRQKNREQIREGIRTVAFNKLCSNEFPLISTVLQIFWDFNHAQLSQHSEKIIETIENTNFQELTDEEHEQIVTDLFYLVHQRILNYPFSIKFKKNQSAYTASLAAYLSVDLEADQLLYWLQFMCEQDKKLVISMIEGDEECEMKWVTNKKLFLCLLQNLKWHSQASLAYKSILLNCDQMSKKDIDLSIPYISNGLIWSHDNQNEQVRRSLVSLLLNVLEVYFKMKENKAKISQLVLLLKKHLTFNLQIFINSDILADLNKLYEAQPDSYLQNDQNIEQILLFIQKKLGRNEMHFQKQQFEYYTNNLFRMFYHQWLSRQLWDKQYSFSMQVRGLLENIGQLTINNVWLNKIRNVMK